MVIPALFAFWLMTSSLWLLIETLYLFGACPEEASRHPSSEYIVLQFMNGLWDVYQTFPKDGSQCKTHSMLCLQHQITPEGRVARSGLVRDLSMERSDLGISVYLGPLSEEL